MVIRYASLTDLDTLAALDNHITCARLCLAIEEQRVLIIESKELMGWLRYSFFWETIPFVDLLFVIEPFRKQLLGTKLMNYFESEMQGQGFKELMLSTSSEESSQHLYLKLGFKTVGGFFPANEPYEIMMVKTLDQDNREKSSDGL